MPFAVIPLILINILAYTGQGFLKKLYVIRYEGPREGCAPFFSVLYGVITCVGTWLVGGCRFAPDLLTLIVGTANGVFLFVYNYTAIRACERGPYTLQNLVSFFGGVMIPLLFTTLYWRSVLKPVQYAGIALMLASLAVYNAKRAPGRILKGFYLFILFNALSNGLFGVSNDFQQRMESGQLRSEMIMLTFGVSALLSVVDALLRGRRGKVLTLRIGRVSRICALGASICAAVACNLIMYLLSFVSAPVLYSIENGGILLATTLLCASLLGEKQSKWQIAGLVGTAAAMVLLNFA